MVLSQPPKDRGAGAPPLAGLSLFERSTVRLVDTIYRKIPDVTELWLRKVSAGWMTVASRHMMFPLGLERLASVKYSDGVLLVSNHRSFFDLYMLLLVLQRFTPLSQRTLNPVRADFFYRQWSGLFVNLIVGAGRMFPPFFREAEKHDFNRWALERVAEELRRGQVIVGFHPEGTRNRNADPYQPLPAQPGVGKLVMKSWPVIVPAFINGLTNDFVGDIAGNMKRGKVVIAAFGEPIDTGEWRGLPDRNSSHKRIADTLLERIYALGQEERVYRARIEEFQRTSGQTKLSGSTFKL